VHRFENISDLERDAFKSRTRDVAGLRVSPQTNQQSAACGSQCGAPRPTNAGTKITPPASGTLAADASTSAEEPMSLRLSRSHCTTARQ